MKISCIIVEDEPLALERTKGYVLKLSFLELCSTFDSGLDALVFLKSKPVDIIFLDINMDDFSGIQLLETLTIKSQVIITTAYDEYALKGFELNVTDYLLKPFAFERFVQAVGRAQDNLSRKEPVPEKKVIFIKTGHKLEKLLLSDVLYIEGMRDYRRINTIHTRIMTLQTFSDLEKEIPPGIICRVHKSYMVSLDKIDSIEKDNIRIRDRFIPISDTYKKAFFDRINHSTK